MLMTRDLFRDIKELRPRDTESSRIVVKRWGENTDPYSNDYSNAQAGDEQALKAFFSITAERLLYRSKVLSLPIDEAFASCDALQCAHPFGQDGPDFASLYAPSVSIAMSFVPLTPEGGGGKPVLVRLYCAKGLADSFQPPFAKGADSPAFARFSWFVAGLPDKFACKQIDGESWLLAAHLLKAVLDRDQAASTRKNLATSFIVTGKVENGSVVEVEMGRKPELADLKEYRSLKWIIPMKNSNDMNNISSRIEKPATLEEAFELIESMQSRATKSFFRFLKAADIDGMKEQYANGADLFAEDETTGKAPLQLIEEDIASAQSLPSVNENEKSNVERQNSLDRLLLARDWLKGQGADCTMMIYILAKSRMLNILDGCLEKFPINARDERGLTAVDWAIIAGDWETANLINSLGGVCEKHAKYNPVLKKIIEDVGSPWKKDQNGVVKSVSDKTREYVKTALKYGLDPDAGDLFSKFLIIGDLEVVELALQSGRNPNKSLASLDFGECIHPILAVAEDKAKVLDEEMQKALIAVLINYGAQMNSEMQRNVKVALARRVVDRAKNVIQQDVSKIVDYLGEGILAFNDIFTIGTHIEYDEPYEGYVAEVSGSLFALALDRGWKDVVKKCLEKGASPTDEIETTYPFFHDTYGIEEKCSPIEYVASTKRRTLSKEARDMLIELLKSYMPPAPPSNMPF